MNTRDVRKVILALIDACICSASALLALVLRFDISAIPQEYLSRTLSCIPLYIIITIGVMFAFRLYNRVWAYASMKELADVLKASLVIEALILGIHILREMPMPRSYYPLDFMMMAILFTAARFGKTILKAIQGTYSREKISKYVMVVGAGSAASILIKEMAAPGTHVKIVCAIDDNENKKNKYLLGVPIVGGREDIPRAVKKYDITDIIIAMPSAPADDIKEIISICQGTGLPIRILPSVTRSLSSSIVKELRPVSYVDLLGRDPIEVDDEGIADFIKDKVVMVTGGGGSIGSELCRQIVRQEPKKLIIFDIYENNAYDIEMELLRHYPEANVSTLIGSVRDYDRLEAVFSKYRPNIVYHAAAHKHVPLMEKSPNEAIKNNCLGTLNLAKLADKYKADNFVLISTDKAVRPTNVMGATKRICEMIVQVYARRSEHTRYAGVRFGNVLGSNGSVIPLFLKQIEEGGPVTVTHKDIRRFFMTIPEAVSLVLQASLYAKGGEIFVLDMGEPVKIYELAENLIRMKGFRPHEDIEIEIVGLRPGEKLYEEVLMDEEGLDKTANDKIYVGKPMEIDDEAFLKQLDELIAEAEKNGRQIKELTEKVCGTYTITDND
ncbi:MAG: polysaccharide biosynthesis protein [Eubacterium sp.]|nr:polysaccharide biosynthesis protein [Eubacterium sp.]MBR2558966.1 polysaccharide biosynthesis protein [Bacillota bacterium]MBR3212742.1 polysaccharide biosynthesis protein [Bacillota bacterium]